MDTTEISAFETALGTTPTSFAVAVIGWDFTTLDKAWCDNEPDAIEAASGFANAWQARAVQTTIQATAGPGHRGFGVRHFAWDGATRSIRDTGWSVWGPDGSFVGNDIGLA